ncbi:MAG: hypothetical protein AABZ60_02795 [Planctomycetota bacterium]
MGYLVDCVDEKTSIITVQGGVDEKLEEVAVNLLTIDKTPNLILDLEQSRPLLGDHIELAVKIHHKCTDHHGVLKLCHLAKETKYVMEIMNLDQFFYIFPTLKDALAADIAVIDDLENLPPDKEAEATTTDQTLPSDPSKDLIEEADEPIDSLKEIEMSEESIPSKENTSTTTTALPKTAEGGDSLPKELSSTPLPKTLPRTLPKRNIASRRVLPQKAASALSLKEKEERVEQFVHYVAKTMIHLKVFEYMVKNAHLKTFSVPTLVVQTKEAQEMIQHVIDHLHKLRIVDRLDNGIYKYAPGPKAVHDIQEFVSMWNHPKNHAKILSWVLAEEKVYMEAQKKLEQEQSQSKGKTTGWKKWFSREQEDSTAVLSPAKPKSELLDEEEEVDAILAKASTNIKAKAPENSDLMTLDLGGEGETNEENLDPDLLIQDLPKTVEFIPKYMSRAALHIKHENLDKAVNDYSAVIDLESGHLKARLKRGEIYEKQEKFRLAVQDYSYLIQKDPKNFVAIKNRSECYYRLLSYDQSVRDCNILINASVFKFDAFSIRGKCNQNLGHFVETVQDLTKALQIKPHWAKGLIYRGKAFFSAKRYKDAFMDFERAYKLNPNYEEAKKLMNEASKKMNA